MQGKRPQTVTAVHRWQTKIRDLSWQKEVLWRLERMSLRAFSCSAYTRQTDMQNTTDMHVPI